MMSLGAIALKVSGGHPGSENHPEAATNRHCHAE